MSISVNIHRICILALFNAGGFTGYWSSQVPKASLNASARSKATRWPRMWDEPQVGAWIVPPSQGPASGRPAMPCNAPMTPSGFEGGLDAVHHGVHQICP